MIAALVIAAALQAAPVFAKSGAVGLTPPPSMEEAEDFAGFADEASGASITIAEMPPEAFAQITSRLDTGTALPNGLAFAGKAEVLKLADGTAARLYRGTQATPQGNYGKWMLLADGRTTTAMVTAQVPAAHVAKLKPAIEAALKSVTLRAASTPEAGLAALPFTIPDRAGFRLVRTLMGSSALLTEGPKDVDPDTTQPLVIVAGSLGDVPVTDRAATARKAFADFPGFADVKVIAEAPGADTSSHRIAGTATTKGKPVTLVQHMRYGNDGGYIRTICVAPRGMDIAARCDRLAAAIRAK